VSGTDYERYFKPNSPSNHLLEESFDIGCFPLNLSRRKKLMDPDDKSMMPGGLE
jgi:hypothetical protein